MDRTDPRTWSVPDHYLCHSAQESPSLNEKPIPRLHRTLMLSLCSCLLLLNLRLVLIKTCQIHRPAGQRKASLQLRGQPSYGAHQGLLGVLKSTIKRGIKTTSLAYPFAHDCSRVVGGSEPFTYQTGHSQVTLH